ncbi:MAG: YbjQ family protein [Euryarchaeota archaeon]|nr:YbjQ family protein [Euryarchaeota archaeon]
MIVVTTETIEGKKIAETLGLVNGNVIRAKHIGKDITATLRHVVGGEIKEYTEMMNDSRDIAFKRMVESAEGLDADAIVGVRFTTSMVMAGASEILIYGTAVKLEG